MSKIRTYESNSQPFRGFLGVAHCCSWCQRYELMRAIHNLCRRRVSPFQVVPDVKDTNLWEQFTTGINLQISIEWLFLMSKIRTYESNSQLVTLWITFGLCCSWCQRYELMRAIHNIKVRIRDKHYVVPDVKDTNLWEQFTTSALFELGLGQLFLMSKIRTYESNSQPDLQDSKWWCSCSWCQRYELMRAIHN